MDCRRHSIGKSIRSSKIHRYGESAQKQRGEINKNVNICKNYMLFAKKHEMSKGENRDRIGGEEKRQRSFAYERERKNAEQKRWILELH